MDFDSYFDAPVPGMDINIVPRRNVYPGAGGGTTATMGSAASPDALQYAPDGDTGDQTARVDVAPTNYVGKPLTWWVGLLVLVGLMLFAARKAGEADEFKNIRASTYNVAFVTFVAVLGITFLKIVAVKVQSVPALGGFATIVKAV